jgi:hypothetical protein
MSATTELRRAGPATLPARYTPEWFVARRPAPAAKGKTSWSVRPIACLALSALAGLVAGAALAVFAAMTAPSVTVGIEYEPLRVAGLAAAEGAAEGLFAGAMLGAAFLLAVAAVQKALGRERPARG